MYKKEAKKCYIKYSEQIWYACYILGTLYKIIISPYAIKFYAETFEFNFLQILLIDIKMLCYLTSTNT